MADDKETRSTGIGSRLAAKLLMPLVATAVSAAAHAPQTQPRPAP